MKGYVGLRRNMKVTVVNVRNNINESMYIRKVSKRWPYDYDVISVNRKPQEFMQAVANMNDRIKRLEENSSAGKKTLFVIKPVGRVVGVGRRYIKRRSHTWTTGYTGFYPGSTKYGIPDVSGVDAQDYGTAWLPLESSADDYYAAFNGTPTDVTYAPKNGLLSGVFNGTTSNVSLGASNALITNNSAWTIAIRFNLDTIASNTRIFNLTTTLTNTAARILIGNTSQITFSYRNGGGTLTDFYTGTGLAVNTWYHAVLTYDGTTYKAYIDGVQVGTATNTFAGFSTGTAYIGWLSGGNYFDGNICDARVYDGRALSSYEVTALYNSGVPRTDNELFFSGWTVDWLVPSEDKYREYFSDTEFVHAGYTTATISTSSYNATASGGSKTLVLGPISKGPSVTRVKITAYFTGTITSAKVGSDPSGATGTSVTLASGVTSTVTLSSAATTLYLVLVMASGCRSEERRVGEECRIGGRYRGSPDQSEKQKIRRLEIQEKGE